jgi:hypothetical protein
MVSFRKHKDLKSFAFRPAFSFNTIDANSCIVYQESTKMVLVIKNNTNKDIYGEKISLELISRALGLYYTIFSDISELK